MSDALSLDTLARTVYGEARGEPDLGRLAVAYVPCNRAAIAARFVKAHPEHKRHPLYGDGTVASACRMPWQFSCWNENDPNRAELLALDLDSDAAAPCMAMARAALDETAPDPSNCATHYHTVASPWPDPDKRWPPKWADGKPPVATIGDHVFYRLG